MSELTKVFEKLAAWRASPKIGQEGQVDEVHGWRNPIELREYEVDELLALNACLDLEEIDAIERNCLQSAWMNPCFVQMRDLARRLATEHAAEKARADEAVEFREIVTTFCQGAVKGLRINYFNGFVVTRSDGLSDQSWDGSDLLEVLREMKTSLMEQWEEEERK